ncbi:MAG: FkbM family methyltransferase [Acidobacteria bacterium]|nr:FkbM family methyltransferase [Acidobacteriota bacterium]
MTKWWRTCRLDVIEVSLVAVLVAVIVTTVVSSRYARLSYVAYSAAQEGARLKDRYGPSRYSRNEEEWIIRDYFQDRRAGSFVDVGANHYKNDSNTFYLESELGWSGIAIDPQAEFAADYRTHRPRTRFFAFFVSDTSDSNITFHLADGNSLVASADQGFAERAGTEIKDPVYSSKAVSVPTIRLSDLLDQTGLSHFDFLSVDVELAEPKVLAGFDINRFAPTLVCIEAHPQVRQQILDYFAAHGYVVLGRYLRADLANLYFAPIGLTAPSRPTAPETVLEGVPKK